MQRVDHSAYPPRRQQLRRGWPGDVLHVLNAGNAWDAAAQGSPLDLCSRLGSQQRARDLQMARREGVGA